MKKAILAFTIVAALTSPSFAQSVGEKTGVNSALGIAPKTEDFIKQAAMSDMTEIETAQIARLKGNAEEKKFADMMLADHTKTSNEIKAMIPTNMKAAVPTALDDASQKVPSCVTRSQTTSLRSMTPCKSAPTRTRCRCSSATQMAATIQSSRTGRAKPCLP